MLRVAYFPEFTIVFFVFRACYLLHVLPLCWFTRSLGFKFFWPISYVGSVFDVFPFGFAPLLFQLRKVFTDFSDF